MHSAPDIFRLCPSIISDCPFDLHLRVFEYRDRTNWRACAAAPFERQSYGAELTLTDQCLQIAQALDMRDIELKTSLVHKRVDVALRSGPYGIDPEVHDALLCQPFGRRDIHARIIGCIRL